MCPASNSRRAAIGVGSCRWAAPRTFRAPVMTRSSPTRRGALCTTSTTSTKPAPAAPRSRRHDWNPDRRCSSTKKRRPGCTKYAGRRCSSTRCSTGRNWRRDRCCSSTRRSLHRFRSTGSCCPSTRCPAGSYCPAARPLPRYWTRFQRQPSLAERREPRRERPSGRRRAAAPVVASSLPPAELAPLLQRAADFARLLRQWSERASFLPRTPMLPKVRKPQRCNCDWPRMAGVARTVPAVSRAPAGRQYGSSLRGANDALDAKRFDGGSATKRATRVSRRAVGDERIVTGIAAADDEGVRRLGRGYGKFSCRTIRRSSGLGREHGSEALHPGSSSGEVRDARAPIPRETLRVERVVIPGRSGTSRDDRPFGNASPHAITSIRRGVERAMHSVAGGGFTR